MYRTDFHPSEQYETDIIIIPLTGVSGVHVYPDAFVVANLGDLVQTVERTTASGAQRGHHEERDQPVGAVLPNGVPDRVAAELVLAVRGQGPEQYAAQ